MIYKYLKTLKYNNMKNVSLIKIFTPIMISEVFSAPCKGWTIENISPNILFIITDDQSFPYCSAYGSSLVKTPGFDYIASQGCLFQNAYVTSPGSSPSRASILSGMYPWQIKEAGTHCSYFPKDIICFTDILEDKGYSVGYTGKGWGPGDWHGRKRNPAGEVYNQKKLLPPYKGISAIDYVENFKNFFNNARKDKPFCFWVGFNEPHRGFEQNSWRKEGKLLTNVNIPGFLPDDEVVKGDLLDYAVEIEWLDSQVLKIIEFLKENDAFDDTLIIMTSDNGMPFPNAKAPCYDAGIHVPLAICWGDRVKRKNTDVIISSIDFAPTIYKLNENYRSAKRIVEFANRLEHYDSVTNYVYDGELIATGSADEESEAKYITDKIEQLMRDGHPDVEGVISPERIAVIARNRYVFSHLEEELTNRNIPFFFKKNANGIENESDFMKVFELCIRILINKKDYPFAKRDITLLK